MLGLSPVVAAEEEGLSDVETASSSTATTAAGAPNSSPSSGSSLVRCSICLSRLSLDCSPSASLAPSPSPAAASRPHCSSDPAWAARVVGGGVCFSAVLRCGEGNMAETAGMFVSLFRGCRRGPLVSCQVISEEKCWLPEAIHKCMLINYHVPAAVPVVDQQKLQVSSGPSSPRLFRREPRSSLFV